jgi:hypothetical protein
MPSIFDELPGFLELGAWTTRHIRPLFDLFRDEDVAPALALIIFGSALVLCFLFIIDSSFIRMQVRRRIRAVRSIRGKVEFAEAMPDIEKLMLRTRYLQHSWQKFRETLIEPSADEDRGPKVVLNTARPQNYFNTAEAGLRFPLYRAMPNLLVGIGLLLTFFGLVTALFFTTVAIKSAADLAASQNALRDLLYPNHCSVLSQRLMLLRLTTPATMMYEWSGWPTCNRCFPKRRKSSFPSIATFRIFALCMRRHFR